MENGCLDIGGKKYLPSAKAAQLVGYTKDYVGQLARAGKIESKLIGRSYYISEDSIRQHKLSVHYTLTQPKKPRKQEARKADITNKKLDLSVTKEGAFVPRAEVEAAPNVSPDVDEPENVLVHVDPDERAIDTVRYAVPDTRPGAADARRVRVDPLVRSDVSYERGEPLYYEDEQPVLPPVREKFGGNRALQDVHERVSDTTRPVAAERRDTLREGQSPRPLPNIQHADPPRVTTRPLQDRPRGYDARQHQSSAHSTPHIVRRESVSYGGGVDGVLPLRSSQPRPMRPVRAAPVQPSRYSRVEEYAPDDQDYPYEEQHERSYEPRRSKVLPLSIAFTAFILFVLWYMIF